MPRSYTADAIEALTPQRTNNFIFRISGVEGADMLQLAVQEVPAPNYTIEALDLQYFNETRHFAGIANYENMSVVFRDFLEPRIASILYAWRQSVWNTETGLAGNPSDYKKAGSLVLLSPDAATERVWQCIGIWPTAANFGSFRHDRPAYNTINVTFSVDKIIGGAGIAS